LKTVYFVGDCSEKAQTVLKKENFTLKKLNTLPQTDEVLVLKDKKRHRRCRLF
jgi:hypothetical protein